MSRATPFVRERRWWRSFAMAVVLATLPPAAVRAEDAPPPAEQFDLWEIQVEGNTLLATQDIERAVYPHLGPARTIDEVSAARQQLEELYHARGYGTVLVDIPEQDVVGGLVRLKVTEAAVGRLSVTGSRYFSLGRIKAAVPSLATGQSPHLPTVQKELAALANQSPDRVVTPLLKPSATPGKLDVELKVKDELPLHGSVTLDDRYSADTSRLRLAASVRYDNLWQRGHSVGVSYLVSPEASSEVEVVSANYLWRFEHLDHLLALYAVRSNSNIATIGTLGVVGNGTIAGLRYTIPLKPLDNWFHGVVFGLDYKDFGESIGLLGNDAVNTPISYAMGSLGYNATRLGKDSTSHLSATLNLGLRGFGNTAGEFERKRFKAVPDFAYLQLSLDHEQALVAGLRLFGRLEGQAASSPLISNESFAAGGVGNTRGYLESEKQGDDALSSTLELRHALWRPAGWAWLKEATALVFTDATGLRVRYPLPGTESTAFLWSTGFGVRLRGPEGFSAGFDWARALRDSARTRVDDDRVHFNVGYEF